MVSYLKRILDHYAKLGALVAAHEARRAGFVRPRRKATRSAKCLKRVLKGVAVSISIFLDFPAQLLIGLGNAKAELEDEERERKRNPEEEAELRASRLRRNRVTRNRKAAGVRRKEQLEIREKLARTRKEQADGDKEDQS